MIKFLAGTVFGIVVATVGLSGLAAVGDKAVQKTQEIVKEAAK